MSTPITDANWFHTVRQDGLPRLVTAELARRLETDRAALMEALEFYRQHMLLGYEITDSGQVASDALAAAKANFPQP